MRIELAKKYDNTITLEIKDNNCIEFGVKRYDHFYIKKTFGACFIYPYGIDLGTHDSFRTMYFYTPEDRDNAFACYIHLLTLNEHLLRKESTKSNHPDKDVFVLNI